MPKFLRFGIIAAVLAASSLMFCGTTAMAASAVPHKPTQPTLQFALIGQSSVNAACQGVNLSSSGTCPNSTSSINRLIRDVINILSVVVGVVAIIMIIVGGLKLITSGGEASKTASARNTILYALIGLVVAVLAQVLVHFVLNKASTITNPSPSASHSKK